MITKPRIRVWIKREPVMGQVFLFLSLLCFFAVCAALALALWRAGAVGGIVLGWVGAKIWST